MEPNEGKKPPEPSDSFPYTYVMAPIRVNRSAFSVGSLHDESDEKEYWLNRTPLERLEALEIIRQMVYGYDPATARLQRIFAITRLERS